MKKLKDNLKFIVLCLLTFFSFYKHLSFINNIYLLYFVYFILIGVLYIFYNKLYKDIIIQKKYSIFVFIMSFVFVLGYSYEIKSTSELVFGNISNFIISLIKIVGYFYFFKTLIYYLLLFCKKEYKYENKYIKKFSKKPFFYSFIFLSFCYGIYLIFYYPGIINYDNANQIKEMLGIHTRYLDAINPISDSTLTNFNPIIHTFLLGGLFKFGYLIGNVNFGLFLYTLLQLVIVISIYSYVISYSVKQKINPLYSFIILIFLGLIPIFGFYSITAVKDTLYATFLLLFSLKLYDFLKKEHLKKSDYISLFLVGVLVCLFRNNGIYIVLFTLPFLLYKQQKLPIISIVMLTIISYISFNNILLPNLGVSPTSIRETLSIPFQQTARLVALKGAEISVKDKEVIENILDYDNLKKDYDEDLADPVKNKYNKDATEEDLKKYFGVWFKGLLKYPNIYIDATINNITGYFYPYESNWKIYFKLNHKLPEAGYDYHYNGLDFGRNFLQNYEIFIEYSPIGLILNIGILTWLSLLIFVMLCNKNKYFIFLVPNIISILFCIVSPANTYYRYIYPTLIIIVCLSPLIKYCLEKKR